MVIKLQCVNDLKNSELTYVVVWKISETLISKQSVCFGLVLLSAKQ